MLRALALILLTLGLLSGPLAADAQPARKVWRIGVLETTSPSLAASTVEAFRQGLRDLGYVEGQNVAIEYRWAHGRSERFPDFAAELVQLRVDVIVTRGTPAALAAKNATKTIPIVMATSGDPIGTGLVASLAHPGGNVTGVSSLVAELVGKRLELLKAVFPTFSRVAVLWNPTSPAAMNDWKEAQASARALGVTMHSLEVRKGDDLERAFEPARRQRSDVLVVVTDAVTRNHQVEIVELAKRNRLPAVYASREFVDAGGLMSYGVSYPDLFRRAAIYVDKIFRGAKPRDLPIEQPTKFELVINLKTANAFGLTIPPALLLRADQVIE